MNERDPRRAGVRPSEEAGEGPALAPESPQEPVSEDSVPAAEQTSPSRAAAPQGARNEPRTAKGPTPFDVLSARVDGAETSIGAIERAVAMLLVGLLLAMALALLLIFRARAAGAGE